MQTPQSVQDARITGMLSDEHDERRASDVGFAADIKDLQQRMGVIEDSVVGLQESVAANTSITAKISDDTGQILDIFSKLKGAVTVAGWLGSFTAGALKVIAAVGALYLAGWAFVQNLLGAPKP